MWEGELKEHGFVWEHSGEYFPLQTVQLRLNLAPAYTRALLLGPQAATSEEKVKHVLQKANVEQLNFYYDHETHKLFLFLSKLCYGWLSS